MKKTFETLATKMTPPKKKIRRKIERGIEEIDKKTFVKLRFDSFLFFKFEIRSVERNWVGIENNRKTGSIGPEESGRNRGNPRLLKEKAFFLLHISISRKIDSISRVSKKHKF